ncbi:YihY/virulence factor BrkB family protein [Pontibacter qinzhouensis]|uniref:YihY/virulence factor BrkB family protein n=1 Tax=Pontibacter qinzhouensis TaxID=2603253 RepID=A0A5C8KBP2_9BACT|nr:YihY/virulence factor BrkB family protein [Pontibacter qinzhouensis]TXK48161.1 YihY/virulence factor BrkB family protein [Pontibacter qinzhouensis]
MRINQQYLKRRRAYRRFIVFLKRWRFNNGRSSVYEVVDVLIGELRLDSITKRASYMAFNFTLAIFPSIIFLFTLIPYVPGVLSLDLGESIFDFLADVLPEEMYAAAYTTIEDIVNKPRGGLLSFGFLFALILSTNGIMSLMDAFDKKYKTFYKRSYPKKRAIATLLTGALMFILFLAVAAIFFGQWILDVLVFYEVVTESYTYSFIIMLKYIAIILLFLLATSLIYYYVPAIEDKWPLFSAGAIVATGLIFAVSMIFSVYISAFDTYNKFYGSIGALIGLMIWLDFISMILILGFEINVSIDTVVRRTTQRLQKKVEGRNLTT